MEGNAALPETTNSYNVTVLSNSAIYNVSVTAVGMCEMIPSDPITVYGEYTSCLHVCTWLCSMS